MVVPPPERRIIGRQQRFQTRDRAAVIAPSAPSEACAEQIVDPSRAIHNLIDDGIRSLPSRSATGQFQPVSVAAQIAQKQPSGSAGCASSEGTSSFALTNLSCRNYFTGARNIGL